LSSPLVSEKAEKALRDIGLTEYESLAYLSLLKSGEMTAEMVSDSSGIPYTKVYSVLEELEERGWIDVEGGRPRKYYPRSPEDALSVEQNRLEEEFSTNRELLVEELLPLYEAKEIHEMPEIWMIRGEANTYEKVISLLGKARKEIMLTLPWVPEGLLNSPENIRLLAYELRNLQNRDIAVKVLATDEVVGKLTPALMSLADVKLCSELFGGGLVIDNKETVLILDMVKPIGPDMAIWSDHESLTRIASVYFQHMWENAEPYKP
jgi:sugar-specific transcriptional regulator TrmB